MMVSALSSSIFVFLFGLSIGSFLNSVIWRLQTEEGLLRERSYCPHCRHQLAAKDLIPLLSYILLKGRCRYCRGSISPQYPLVELSTAILFVASFWYISFPVFPMAAFLQSPALFLIRLTAYFYYFFLISLFIIIFVYDLKHYIIPDKIIFIAIGLALFYRFFEIFNVRWQKEFGLWDLGPGSVHLLSNPLLAGVGAALFFGAIFAFSRGKWMGFGDVKLSFLLGFALGFPNVVVALFMAFLLGAIIGVWLVLLKRKAMKSEVPFGPFLITGTLIALFFGQQILSWYFNLFW